jgi:hypothetical protein
VYQDLLTLVVDLIVYLKEKLVSMTANYCAYFYAGILEIQVMRTWDVNNLV